MPLFHDRLEDVRLERWAPGADISVNPPGGMEVLVLEGAFTEGREEFRTHSWLRLAPGQVLNATVAASGCRLWAKSGHLDQTTPR